MGWAATHRATGDSIEGPNDYDVRRVITNAGGDPADYDWEMTPIVSDIGKPRPRSQDGPVGR